MPNSEKLILAINPGSTSTKVGVYCEETARLVKNIRHSDADLQPFKGKSILDQHDFRRRVIVEELTRAGIRISDICAVAGRGGLLHPLASGTYRVNQRMLDELRAAQRGEHASNLGAYLAQDIATEANCAAFVVDPVSVDEWPQRSRLSGHTKLPRQCLSHALNTKAVAKRFARERGVRYEELRLIVAHVGSGISVSAHQNGRMIDVTNSREEGAFSTERSGSIPCMSLVELCFSGNYTRQQVETMLFREGGLYSYLGTKDLVEVEERIKSGDETALLVFDAMGYQIAKEIGAMGAALQGCVDAVLLTGGMAYSEKLMRNLREFVAWIAPLHVYPGEDELQALAEGALRVLRGEEAALRYAPAATMAKAAD